MTESEPSPRQAKRDGLARFETALYAFAGIILPLVAFGCAAPTGSWLADQPWQSGEFWVYATLMMKWPAVWPFYPLLLFSMASLGLHLWDGKRFAEFFLVRLGIYGGVILALVFSWLFYAPTDVFFAAVAKTMLAVTVILVVTFVALIVIALLGVVLMPWVLNRVGWRGLAGGAAIVGLFLGLLALIGSEGVRDSIAAPFFLTLIVMLGVSPAWAAGAYACAAGSIVLERRRSDRRWNLKSLFAISTWIASLFGAWRWAMNLAISEYATLPTEDPSCFVCSAAARGHRRFVRSEAVWIDGKRVVWINCQLRVMKAAELTLMAAAPRVHRAFRRVYNLVGPRLARRMRNPWIADAAYVALKPAEWMARLALWLFGVHCQDIARLYSNRRH